MTTIKHIQSFARIGIGTALGCPAPSTRPPALLPQGGAADHGEFFP
jgi:hypothetical protein